MSERRRITGVTRRACLTGLAAACAASARAATAPRLVCLDWGLTETLLALGANLVGAAEVRSYNEKVATIKIPPAVSDVGLRLAPDMECLQLLQPAAIVINGSQDAQQALLQQVAPVWPFSIYDDSGQPLKNAEKVTGDLAGRLHCQARGKALLGSLDVALKEGMNDLAGYDGRPLYVFNFLDARHIALYDRSSLIQGIMDELGLDNAWKRQSGGWGVVPLPAEMLATTASARLVCFGPVPADAHRMMAGSPLWRSLPAVRTGRIRFLPPIWNFGALPTALRMAQLLTAALSAPDALS